MNICFVAHFARRAFSDASDGHIGGVERQTNLMARWLAENGHKVSVIVWGEYGEPAETVVDGIRVISLCGKSDGLPGLRFFTPRWSSLITALKRADADIYYQNCAEAVTGQVALWARGAKRRFIYSVASDPDCDANLPKMKTFRERWLYRYGLNTADLVIVQTELQRNMLQENFQRASLVLPMPCETLPKAIDNGNVPANPGAVVWIGRLAPVKRPEAVVDIAKRCAQFRFDVVGPKVGTSEYASTVLEKFESCDNASLLGSANFSSVRRYYEQSALLLCTSEYEGFPNTFLEAWSCGCPVVSTVDPDGVITRHRLGKYSPDLDRIPDLIREVAANRDEYATRCLEYFSRHHEKDLAMRRFEHAFQDLEGFESKRG
jgi:glycosyltransferase involved in cell wall biosynthesis